MEFVEGIREKDTLELTELLKKQETDGEILVEGTVHSIRKMGEIAFVILRKKRRPAADRLGGGKDKYINFGFKRRRLYPGHRHNTQRSACASSEGTPPVCSPNTFITCSAPSPCHR